MFHELFGEQFERIGLTKEGTRVVSMIQEEIAKIKKEEKSVRKNAQADDADIEPWKIILLGLIGILLAYVAAQMI